MFYLPKFGVAFKVIARDRFERVAANPLTEFLPDIQVRVGGPIIRFKYFKLWTAGTDPTPGCLCLAKPLIFSHCAEALRIGTQGVHLPGLLAQSGYHAAQAKQLLRSFVRYRRRVQWLIHCG